MSARRPSGDNPLGLLDRRQFLSSLGAMSALLVRSPLSAFASRTPGGTPTLYYIDGYHGGTRGHMPHGCWRDIVEALRANPEWKLSLDVEAPSWEVLKRDDPESFHRLGDYIANRDGKGRVEIVGGTFSQPYGWAVSGESNIRQLQRGLELIHERFAGAHVETYAVQEPCWASCMPQILRSLGFTGASLKNASTAWGGYTQGLDAELVNWIGPDGTSLPAVPRYECEDLLNVWETEATEVTPDYARKCVEHGIPQPVGMCFQDLGWAAQPRAAAPWIRFATWREYMLQIAQTKPRDWHFSMEDILTALPWGEKTLHRAARQVREAEVLLVAAEKIAAIDGLQNHGPWPKELLSAAWEQTMWSQAHDAWITVTTRSGREAWAFQVGAETMQATQTAQQIIDSAASHLCIQSHSKPNAGEDAQYLRAINSLGHDREDLVEIAVPTDRGTQAFAVLDSNGNRIPCQFVVTRKYRTLPHDEAVNDPVFENSLAGENTGASINDATLLFRARVPAFGWNTYKVESLKQLPGAHEVEGIHIFIEENGSVVVESDLYRIRLDAQRGGAISSLHCKALGKEFCAEGKLLNEFRGYFAAQQKWRSSLENPAHIEVLEQGPVRAKVQVLGTVGGCPFRSIVTVVQGQRRIDFQVTFHFEEDTWIGDPWDIEPQNRMKERRRSSNDGRWKLQALFPAHLKNGAIYKNSAFDVCRSRNASTHFQRWDEIKHNIITNWVDLLDQDQNIGLAIISDRTTAYSYGDGHPLGLILGWSGEAGFWWGRCSLRGEQESAYSIVPHERRWDEAHLWQQNLSVEEPIVAQWMEGIPAAGSHARSLMRISTPEAVLSSAQFEDNRLEARIFQASGRAGECKLEFGFPVSEACLIELDGRVQAELPVQHHQGGVSSVALQLPKVGLRTIRVFPAQHS